MFNNNCPMRPWLDVDGNPINVHGGGIMFHDGLAYWYGECRPVGDDSLDAQIGVAVYVSDDLVNWRYGGVCLTVAHGNTDHPLAPGCKIERPKVIFNAAAGKFVMWWHHDLLGRGHASALAAVAVADSPTGSFTFIRVLRPNLGYWPVNASPDQKTAIVPDATANSRFSGGAMEEIKSHNLLARDYPSGQMARDMTLYLDDDGKAYHVFASEENATLHIAELSDDFLSHSGRFARVFEHRWMEAPCIFKKDGKYYFLGSGCTGWAPNDARTAVSSDIFEGWKELGNPCRGINPENGMGQELTFGGQSTCVFTIPGTDISYAMFDLWNPQNLHDSRYLWLKMKWANGSFTVSCD